MIYSLKQYYIKLNYLLSQNLLIKIEYANTFSYTLKGMNFAGVKFSFKIMHAVLFYCYTVSF